MMIEELCQRLLDPQHSSSPNLCSVPTRWGTKKNRNYPAASQECQRQLDPLAIFYSQLFQFQAGGEVKRKEIILLHLRQVVRGD